MIQVYPLSPFPVVGRLACEDRHVAVTEIDKASAILGARGRRSSLGLWFRWLSHVGQGKVIELLKIVLAGLKAVGEEKNKCKQMQPVKSSFDRS